ncbi:MAG: response regulator [Armatimonadetes bacterium]|nr:response regulator [Armatimonadota bacterium]
MPDPQSSQILVVDDNPQNVTLLKVYLSGDGYRVITAFDGSEALQKIDTTPPDLVLLDIMMPRVDGYEVLEQMKKNPATWFVPIIMLTSLSDREDRLRAIELGADDFITKPFNKLELMTRVRALLRLKHLHDDLDDARHIIYTLAVALEAKDPYTKGHSERVGAFSAAIAMEMGLSRREANYCIHAGILHDIGKIGLSEAILRKAGPLSGDEYDEVKKHPTISFEICKPLRMCAPYLPIIKHHQERYDGKGYPDGLSGDEIPIGARVMAVADAYDAMTSSRAYRQSLPEEEALSRLRKSAGSQLDPAVVEAFFRIYERKRILESAQASASLGRHFIDYIFDLYLQPLRTAGGG